MTPLPERGGEKAYESRLVGRRRLSDRTFELELTCPDRFAFTAGQRIRLTLQGESREYTPVSAPDHTVLRLCVRRVAGGTFTRLLSTAEIGSRAMVSGPAGYFTFRPSERPAVFVATGTGIAPFVSMSRAGVTGFTLLHGVRHPGDLYYRSELAAAAAVYFPCISGCDEKTGELFRGRVTGFLDSEMPAGVYDFYLCGRREMTRDATLLIDDRFPESRVFSEVFF
jgi:benzoate/toluate 1,2-dioxygenase reductase component